ncbi:MAG TPA: hypothetical protein VFU81_02165 [Thermomicrobiales bacterium]|nr:hypothetical protein [Thermomicrobiales bacterium]
MWEALTTPAGAADVFSPLADVFLAIFCAGFVVAIVLYNGGTRKIAVHPMIRRTLRRYAGWGIAIFGAGLFFFGVRALQINPFTFGMPIWLWLCALAAVILIAWAAFDLVALTPQRIRAWEQSRLKREYLRRGATPESVSLATKSSPKSSRSLR